MASTAAPTRYGRWPVFVGIAVVLLTAAIFAGGSLVRLQRSREAALAQGKELAFIPGDLSLRDAPKAFRILEGDVFADAHYAGEAHWYPFMTPLLASAVARLGVSSMTAAFIVAAIALNALLLVTVGLMLFWHLGWIGFVAFGVGLAAGTIGYGNNPYPLASMRLPLTLYLLVAGALCFPPAASRRRAFALFGLLGLLNGLLGLWQGASFVVASFLSALLLARYAWFAARQHRRDLWLAMGLFVAVAGGLFALLIGPQLLRYGTFVEAESARSYLDKMYGAGDNAPALFGLALFGLGNGAPLLLALGFLSVFIRNPDRGSVAKAAPLLLAWLFAMAMAQLGFVQNSTHYPLLARISQTLLLAPAHTFFGVGLYVFGLMQLIGLGVWLAWLSGWAARRLSGLRARTWFDPALAVAKCALVALPAALVITRIEPLEDLHITRLVPREDVEFARDAARLVPAGAGVFGAEGLMQYAPLRPFYVSSAAHTNPYAQPRRTADNQVLADADGLPAGERADVERVLRADAIAYAIAAPGDGNPLLWLCAQSTLLSRPNGYALLKLKPDCPYPAPERVWRGADSTAQANARVGTDGALLSVESGASGGAFGSVDYPPVDVSGGDLVGLTVTGAAARDGCLGIGALFRNERGGAGVDVADAGAARVVSGPFEVSAWFAAPAAARSLVPRLSLDPACFGANQRLAIDSISFSRKPKP